MSPPQKFAGTSFTKIPEASAGMPKLIADYSTPSVATFHEWFYSQEHHPPERWPDTYDRFSLETLPACVRMALEQPNDLLLKPARIRQLTRIMLALGWHPRHIAGLIHSKYAQAIWLDAI